MKSRLSNIRIKINNETKKVFLLGLFILISGIILLFSNNLKFDIISMLILTFGAAYVVKFNIFHPFVWYSAAFSMYSLGYPILIFLNSTSVNYGYTKELMLIQWLALVTFLIVVSPKLVNVKSVKNNVKKFDCVLNKYIFFILSIIIFGFVIYLKVKGFSSKHELASSQSIIVFIGMRLTLIYILISCIEIIKGIYKNGKISFNILVVTSFLLFLLFFYSAERDLLLRYILIIFFIYYIFIYNRKQKFKLIIILLGLALIIPFSKSIKHLGMRGETYQLENSIVVEVINSEFHTQARNVQLLLNDDIYKGHFKGQTIVASITNLIGVSNISAMNWFQQTYYPTSKTGMGFSLVGEGYINFGYLGVILVFSLVAIIIKISYRKSNQSIFKLIAYLMLIPISIYSIRADLFNLLSQYFKQVLLILILIKFIDELIVKKYKSNSNGVVN